MLSCCLFLACTSPTESDPVPDIDEKAELDESIAAKIPHVYITTDGGVAITSKDDYVNAEVSINGNSVQADLDKKKTRIKGRGNSTWFFPKKPYRLKLDENASILDSLLPKIGYSLQTIRIIPSCAMVSP